MLFRVKRQCVVCVSWLLLFHSLITPGETTFLETPVDADGQVIWDPSGKVSNLLETDVSESGLGDVRRKPEEALSDLTGTRVLVIESSDKEDWITAGVDLIVDRPMRKKGALTFGQDVVDEASTVLSNEPGFHLSAHEVKDLGCPGVCVRGVHAAWLHLADSHGNAIGEQGWEIRDVSGSHIAARVFRSPDSRSEVE